MTTRGGLGRGLGALIPVGASPLEELETASIVPNRRQPRRRFDEDSIAELSASIRQVGLLQPVVVRPEGARRYELVLGERRWRAAIRAGLRSIPAIVVETDERGSLERALIENIHREDLNPMEEAAGFQQLISEAGLTHEQLGERVGLSRPTVTNAIRLLELPASVQRLVIEGQLSAGHARALLGLPGPALVERVARRVATEGLSVRETEELVRRQGAIGSKGGRSRASAAVSPGLVEASERLSEALGTRVRVWAGRRKGKIVIEFGSAEDLERISRLITGGREPAG